MEAWGSSRCGPLDGPGNTESKTEPDIANTNTESKSFFGFWYQYSILDISIRFGCGIQHQCQIRHWTSVSVFDNRYWYWIHISIAELNTSTGIQYSVLVAVFGSSVSIRCLVRFWLNSSYHTMIDYVRYLLYSTCPLVCDGRPSQW